MTGEILVMPFRGEQTGDMCNTTVQEQSNSSPENTSFTSVGQCAQISHCQPVRSPMHDIILLIYLHMFIAESSAVKRLIAYKNKRCLRVCTVFIYYVYINTHAYSIYFFYIYMSIFIFI